MAENEVKRKSHLDAQNDPTQADPISDDPTWDDPTQDDPEQDDPTLDDPEQDDPTLDDPEQDDPTLDDPEQDDPTLDDPEQDDPTLDDPEQDDPTLDDPEQDDPTLDDPELDDPEQDDPTLDDPEQDDPTLDDPEQDDPEQDDPTLDDPEQDDPSLDDPEQDDPEQDDPEQDDPTLDDPEQDDPTLDDPELDDPTLDDPEQDDPTLDDPEQDDPTLDDPEQDDPEQDDPTLDDPEQDDPSLDDPEQDDPEQDDPTLDDPEQDDPEQDDPTLDDPEQDDSSLDDSSLDYSSLDDPSLDDPEEDDPEQDDPEQDDPTLDDPEQDDPEQDDPTLDDPEQDDPSWSDPLCLTSVVVDKILEHMDDQSLLTGRMVCRFWNEQIISRQNLWKQRCQWKHGFHFDVKTALRYNFHNQYIDLHRVYRRMLNGDAFQIDEHSEVLDCFHGAREDGSLSQTIGVGSERIASEVRIGSEVCDATSENVLPRQSQPKTCIELGAAPSLFEGNLVMTDLKTKEELWRHEKISVIQNAPSHTYAVTRSGDVKKFSLDGRCQLQIHTAEKLKDACSMSLHHSHRFIIVGLHNYDLYLVDVDNKEVIKLRLPFPEMPDDEEDDDDDEEEEEEDEDDIKRKKLESLNIGFLTEKSLSNMQMAVYAFRMNCMVVAIIEKSGRILHQASKTYHDWYMSAEHTTNSPSFLSSTGRHVQNYSICCESSGIQFKLEWQKKLPKCFRSLYRVIYCGYQFIVGVKNRHIVIHRLDNGRRVISVPEFVRTQSNRSIAFFHRVYVSSLSLKNIVNRVAFDQASQWRQDDHRGIAIIANLDWLAGLSPTTTNPDVPVLLFMSGKHTDIKCLRWSADLWPSAD